MPERRIAAADGEAAVVAAVRVALSSEETETLVLIDQDARTLIEAAAALVDAETPEALGAALSHNLRVWLAIRTLVTAEGSTLPANVRANLARLAGYVACTTLDAARGRVTTRSVRSLAEINLAIADGLRQSQQNRLIRDRARQLWEQQNRPAGRESEFLAQAEREITALLAQD